MPRAAHCLPLLLSTLALGCSEGGSKVLPSAEVQLTANHHLWMLSSLVEFSAFPIPAAEVVGNDGTFSLSSDSTYTVTLSGANPASESYALRESGELSVLVTPSSRSATINFLGGYGLEGDTGVFFFTDRFANTSTNPIAMFWGTEIDTGTPDVEGDWHFFSQHIIHAQSSAFTTSNVARTVGGSVSIDATGAITGQGKESTRANLTFGGNATPFAGGEVTLVVDYDDSQTVDARPFATGVGIPDGQTAPRVILGVDSGTGDGEAGLVAMLAHRTGTASTSDLEGTFHLGMQFVHIDPAVRRSSTGNGTLTFNGTDGFKIEILRVGPGGTAESVEWSGTYTLADDGTLTFTIPTINEVWVGAVDQDYQTVILADNFGDNPTEAPEVAIGLALREVPD